LKQGQIRIAVLVQTGFTFCHWCDSTVWQTKVTHLLYNRYRVALPPLHLHRVLVQCTVHRG